MLISELPNGNRRRCYQSWCPAMFYRVLSSHEPALSPAAGCRGYVLSGIVGLGAKSGLGRTSSLPIHFHQRTAYGMVRFAVPMSHQVKRRQRWR